MEVPKTMKVLIKNHEMESYEYTDMDVPEPEGDEVLIKVDAVSICGSDIPLYKWSPMARVIATVPFIPGHEAAGTVVKCGPEADLEIGSRVGVENHFNCGDCFQCRQDQREICQHMGQYGHGRKTKHGGCSEYSIVPQKYLFKITKDLSAEEITMMEPLGVAHNGVERLRVEGEDVLVVGCGPIGLLAQRLAKVMGAKRVIGADIEDWKLQLAKDMGTDVVINTRNQDIKQVIMELTDWTGIGRICECSGVAAMVNSCFSYLRKGGRVVLIGLPKQPLTFEHPLPDIMFKCVTIKTVHGRRMYHTWEAVEALLASHQVDVTKVISHRFPMSNFREAFEVLFNGTACKIVMDPSK
ncbi:L-threonine 3-dehydrogenase-like [Mya arenaria]|uniref:L-threonine 3-dehydrogenase-like n=1 Tax=Mya arenaria TaxID=6604 RepID=UPI0022E52381|nr:L-threonine 3-dehydrogenase-like [Mya arenaria]XP_052790084.1 L-threonine 3-dehydrogenase-like [Mya arenaria]